VRGFIAVAVLLTACGPQEGSSSREVSPRQQPTVTTPGVTVGGYVNVGVVREF
tara:strand:- start:17798 stop:17956 length:159 start_codon:yes stop_codon:yes gene_type:complete